MHLHTSQLTRRWPLHLLALVLTFILFNLPTQVYAQGPSGSYVEGISCVNTSTTTTSASLDFYNIQGQLVTSVPNASFAPGTSWQLFTPSISGLGSDFLGSAVFRAGQAAFCSINKQLVPGGTNRVSSYPAIDRSSMGPKAYATQIMHDLGGFDSYVVLQNGEASAATVTAYVYNASGDEISTETVSIPAYSSHAFYQTEMGLPSGFVGSAIFETEDGSGLIGGSVHLYNDTTSQLMSYSTVKRGTDKIYLPRMVKNLSGVGYTSGWACQNIGSAAVDMEMSVTMHNQLTDQVVQTTLSKQTVGVGQSWTGYLGSSTNATLNAIERGVGSAIVTSSGGQIACTVNEDNRTAFNGQGDTYNGIFAGAESTQIFIPQVVALGENSFRGGFQFFNTTSTATTCTYTFSNGDVLANQPMAADESLSIFAENILINDRTSFNGSVVIDCGQPIVGLYNLSIIGDAATGDPFTINSINFSATAVNHASLSETTQFIPEITK